MTQTPRGLNWTMNASRPPLSPTCYVVGEDLGKVATRSFALSPLARRQWPSIEKWALISNLRSIPWRMTCASLSHWPSIYRVFDEFPWNKFCEGHVVDQRRMSFTQPCSKSTLGKDGGQCQMASADRDRSIMRAGNNAEGRWGRGRR